MPDTITGSTIADRYKITGFLRSGRMGDIYVARRLDDGRRITVKLLDPQLFSNEEAVKRFAREARVTQTIDHPASMAVLDLGEGPSGPYLVMEYVDGEPLADVLAEEGPLAPDRAARITARIAMALAAAHDQGVIHRDLAPTNVMLADQGSHRDIVKVADFGLALLTGMDPDDDEQLTAVGVRIGTPTYMAPEYIRDFELDSRADIYGLGVMLYEMLTGRPPYEGRPYKVMDQHVHEPIPRPSAAAPDVPGWLDDLVVAMMAKEPEARVQSATEVVRLVELGLSETLEALTYRSTTGAPAMPRAVAAASPPPDPLAPMIRSHILEVAPLTDPRPATDRMFVVGRVASPSVAAALGVVPGWRIWLPDSDAGSGLLDPDLPPADSRRYAVFPAGGQAPFVATTTAIPAGMQLLRSPQNIVANYDPLAPSGPALLDLWQQGRYAQLEHLTLLTLTGRGQDETAPNGTLAQILTAQGPRPLDPEALVLYGAALYETERRTEGMRWMSEYATRHAGGSSAVYTAIPHLYRGLEALRQGRAEAAADLFLKAYWLGWLPRAESRYLEIRGASPPLTWVGRAFPDYDLAEIPSGEQVNLSTVCSALPPGRFVAACVMGSHRANLDYDAVVRRFTRFHLGLGDRSPVGLAELHVVTVEPSRVRDHPEYHAAEDQARAAGLPIRVLQDPRAVVHRAVRPSTLPTVFLIDPKGICVHQGTLRSWELWNALAASTSAVDPGR